MQTMSALFQSVSFLPGRFVAWTTRKIGCCQELIGIGVGLGVGVGVIDVFCLFCSNSFIHEKDDNFEDHIRLCQDQQSTKMQREGEK